MPLSICWTVAGHRFDENEPVSCCVMDYDVGHFPMPINRDAQFSKVLFIPSDKLIAGISDVEHARARRESGTEIVNYLFNKDILAARGQSNRCSTGQSTAPPRIARGASYWLSKMRKDFCSI